MVVPSLFSFTGVDNKCTVVHGCKPIVVRKTVTFSYRNRRYAHGTERNTSSYYLVQKLVVGQQGEG